MITIVGTPEREARPHVRLARSAAPRRLRRVPALPRGLDVGRVPHPRRARPRGRRRAPRPVLPRQPGHVPRVRAARRRWPRCRRGRRLAHRAMGRRLVRRARRDARRHVGDGHGVLHPAARGACGDREDAPARRRAAAGEAHGLAAAGGARRDRVRLAHDPRRAHGAQARMRLAHVRERHAPAGAAWRLAAALDAGGATWLDLEVARRRAVAANRTLEHDFALFRRPVTTLDDHLAAGLRVAAIGDLVDGFRPREEDDDATIPADDLAFGPPVLRPPSFRDFYAFEQHARTTWARRGQDIPEPWYRLPVFYFSNVSELRGPRDPVWAPRGSVELD